MPTYHAASGSAAEDLFIDLFADTFGAEKAGYLYSQYPFFDIYRDSRFADFALETGMRQVAFELDDEASHNSRLISTDKFYDHLLKQNMAKRCTISTFQTKGKRTSWMFCSFMRKAFLFWRARITAAGFSVAPNSRNGRNVFAAEKKTSSIIP